MKNEEYEKELQDIESIDILERRIKEGYEEVALAYSEDFLGTDITQESLMYIFYHPEKIMAINEFYRRGYGLGKFLPFIEGEFNKKDFKEYCKKNKIAINQKKLTEEALEEFLNG